MRVFRGVEMIFGLPSSARSGLTAVLLFGALPAALVFLGCKKPNPPQTVIGPLPSAQAGQAKTSSPEEQSCRAFVQDFYDWFAPISIADKDRLPVSLRPRRSSFEPKLWNMLVADDEAQRHAHEIVGLDFDPILASQDPSSKFVVESASSSAGHCKAAVIGVEEGTDRERVMPELRLIQGNWIFVDFHYQFENQGKLADSSLLQILEDLKEQRSHDLKEKSK